VTRDDAIAYVAKYLDHRFKGIPVRFDLKLFGGWERDVIEYIHGRDDADWHTTVTFDRSRGKSYLKVWQEDTEQ